MSAMLFTCFWPFEFHPHNDVVNVPGQDGLRFQELGTAYSRDPFPSLRNLSASSELTVELTVRPTLITNSGVPHIFSFVAEQGSPALVIGAWKKSLVVRLGRPGNPEWSRYQEIGVDDVFVPGRVVHLLISLGPQGTNIFVDGRCQGSFPKAHIDTSGAPLGRILLGNSPMGNGLWKGDLLALALFDRALTSIENTAGATVDAPPGSMVSDGSIARYRFDKFQGNLVPNTSDSRYDIVVPTDFAPLRRTILEAPRVGTNLKLWFLEDVVLNISGFIPFGFLAMLCLSTTTSIASRRQSSLVVLAGFSLSLFVELTQVLLPTRSSSLIDLATNTLGSALGVLVYFILCTTKLTNQSVDR